MLKFIGYIFTLAIVIVFWIWLRYKDTPVDQMTLSTKANNLTGIATVSGTLIAGIIFLSFLFYYIIIGPKKKN